MPVNPTYPGVYIEEVPSSVRTITGVATSITAFVGRALRGPTDEPRRITSWGDFERLYGGLWVKSSLGYAVSQYFLNGGADAVIARVHSDGVKAWVDPSTETTPWEFRGAVDGAAANDRRVSISHNVDGTFNILVEETVDGGLSWSAAAGGVQDDVDHTTLTAGDTIATLQLGAAIPTVRPAALSNQRLAGGIDQADASVTIANADTASSGTATLRTVLNGALGNSVRAVVTNADTGAGTYDISVELVDDNGVVVASAEYTAVEPSTAWSSLTPVVTGSNPLDLTTETDTPAVIPENGTHRFEGGRDGATSLVQIAPEGTAIAFEASSEGTWGNSVWVATDHDTSDNADPTPALVNVLVEERDSSNRPVATEVHRNLSMDPEHKRYIATVLEQASDLVRVRNPASLPTTRAPVTALSQLSAGSDGSDLSEASFIGGSVEAKNGIWLLEKTDLFNLLVIPPITRTTDVSSTIWTTAMKYCKDRRAVLLVDAPSGWNDKNDATTGLNGLGLQGDNATNAAFTFPWVKLADPLAEYRLKNFAPSAAVAGTIARTDAQRGVWKAPAGIDASLTGVRGLTASLTDPEQGQLNPLGVNVLRAFPVIGTVIWGARTIRGADVLANEWKYLPVRRLALMIEESLYRGSQWAVFEGNDERLWSQLRLNIRAFMHDLFRQGAFQGPSPRDAYLVKCDSETTTQSDIDKGIVNVVVGFRPLKPAEFVILKISQLAGQAA